MILTIKTIMLILIFGTSVTVGNLISKRYVNREKELKEIKSLLNLLETKIRYTYEALPEIFEEISQKVDGNVGNIFKSAVKKMKDCTAGRAWEESIDEAVMSINSEDKTTLKSLGRMLGQTDAEGQISQIRLVNNFIENQIEMAEEERQKNEKMYKTLGGIIGLAIVILLV